jgi:hypothetical protein
MIPPTRPNLTIRLKQFIPIGAPILVLVAVAVLWLSTLQTSMGASNDPVADPTGMVGMLMDDSGEFVVAWHTWGVTHPPGYPLLNFIANVFTHVLVALGVKHITAASLVSFIFGLAALVVLARSISPPDKYRLGSASAVLLAAFGRLVWLYASVAEVYALALLLGFGSIWLALEAGSRPQRRTALALGAVLGLAWWHHRMLALLLPSIAFAAWPARSLGWKVWLGSAALAILSVAVYLYLPIAALIGSPWVYGRSPLTLEGLTDAIVAREYSGQIIPPTAPAEIIAALIGRVQFLAQELTAWGLALGVIGLAIALAHRDTRRLAVVFSLPALAYLSAPVGQYLLIGTHLPIMIAALAVAGGFGVGVTALSSRRPASGWVGLGIAIMMAVGAIARHRETILLYTHDPLGERLITEIKNLDDEHPTVVELWGPRFFALAYGKWATGELSRINLVDGRGNLSNLPSAPVVLYTTKDLFSLFGPDVWSERLGGAVALESAGGGIVAVRRAPRIADNAPVSDSQADVTINAAEAQMTTEGDVRLTVEWRAVRPSPLDYHIAVMLTDQPQIDSQDDVIAQGDRPAPVYGLYPTSNWQSDELVRDDYRVAIPKGRAPTHVVVGLYTIAADGSFTTYASWNVPIK